MSATLRILIAEDETIIRLDLRALLGIVGRGAVVELPTPDGHVPRAVSAAIPAAIYRATDILCGELSAVAFRDACEIRNADVDQRCDWPVAVSTDAVTTRAQLLIHLQTGHLSGTTLGCARAACYECEDNAD